MTYLILVANIGLSILALFGLYFCGKARVSATAFLLAGGCLGFILLQVIWFTVWCDGGPMQVWRELPRIAVWLCFLVATVRFGRGLAKLSRFTESRKGKP